MVDLRTDTASPERETTTEVLYRSEVSVRAPGGPDKLVRFAAGDDDATMGMSGSLGVFYGAEPGTYTERASTLDYVVGAAAACLLGTFRRALIARGIAVTGDDLTASAYGDVVLEGDVPILRTIVVSYRLKAADTADPAAIQRAHAVHHRACAVSRSLEGSIEIRTELELG